MKKGRVISYKIDAIDPRSVERVCYQKKLLIKDLVAGANRELTDGTVSVFDWLAIALEDAREQKEDAVFLENFGVASSSSGAEDAIVFLMDTLSDEVLEMRLSLEALQHGNDELAKGEETRKRLVAMLQQNIIEERHKKGGNS